MSWARIEDNFHSHPTTWQVGLEANGLFVRAISYCAEHLTDGFVPEEWVYAQMPGTKRTRDPRNLTGKLEESRLWERVEGGWFIREYLNYNFSRSQVLAEREAKKEMSSRGGNARARGMSADERSAVARKAAMTRWAKGRVA